MFVSFLNYLLFYFSSQAQLNSLLPGIDDAKLNHFPAASGILHDPKLLTSSLRHGQPVRRYLFPSPFFYTFKPIEV